VHNKDNLWVVRGTFLDSRMKKINQYRYLSPTYHILQQTQLMSLRSESKIKSHGDWGEVAQDAADDADATIRAPESHHPLAHASVHVQALYRGVQTAAIQKFQANWNLSSKTNIKSGWVHNESISDLTM